MKQTAVEWLIEQLEWDDSKIARVVGLKKYNQVVSQAKEMEKQQQGYSEEEVVHLLKALQLYKLVHIERIDIEEWFENFKNK